MEKPLLPINPATRGALFYLIHWAAVGAFLPFLNVYFVQLGFSGRQIGWISAIFPLTTLFLAPALAALADRRRWRVRVLQVCLAGTALSFFLLGLPTTFAGVLAIVFLLAIFRSAILSLADSLIARMAARYGLSFGGMRLWGSLGFAVMAILAGAIWARTGYGPMFAVTALLYAAAIWLAGLLEEGSLTQQQERISLREIVRDRWLVAMLIATWLVGLTLGVAIIFEGIYMAHLGGSELLIGLFLGLIGFAEIPGMRFSDPLIRRLGGLKTLLLAYGLFGGSFVGYALASTPGLLLVLGLVRGVGFGLFLASTIRLMDERAPEAWTSTVQSLREAGMFGLAPLLAAPVAGEMFDLWGPQAVFLLGAAATGLAALVLYLARSYNNRYPDLF